MKSKAPAKAADPPEFTTVPEIAARIGMSPQFVYQALRDGRIAHLRLGSSPKARVKIRKADAEAYVQSVTVGVKP